MKLSSKSLYAVRALFDMAYHGTGAPSKIEDIARRQGVPPRFLEQIFQDLKRAELVVSKRGPRGGYLLQLDPEQITVGAVVRAVEGALEESLCPGRTPDEERGEVCCGSLAVTDGVWQELAERIAQVLDSISLQDLVDRGQEQGVKREGYNDFIYVI